jgi:hypothetical protein
MDYSQYFDFGAPDSQGLHYGLWEPVLNRFLLVLSDIERAKTIKFLASSRYKLFLIDLTTANNYSVNLIDNSCCENWSLGNRGDISIIHPSRYVDPILSQTLVQVDPVNDWNVDQEKIWLQIILAWLKFIERLKNQHPWMVHDNFIHNLYNDTELPGQGNSWYDRLRLLEKNILKLLYLGQDVDTVCQEIELAVKQDSYIYNIWQQWESVK